MIFKKETVLSYLGLILSISLSVACSPPENYNGPPAIATTPALPTIGRVLSKPGASNVPVKPPVTVGSGGTTTPPIGGSTGQTPPPTPTPVPPGDGALSVSGNQILRDGKPFRLIGVNRAGTEFTCIQSGTPGNLGWNIFGGDSDQASIDAMLAWHINTVRVPLNEDCWLGINGVNPLFGAAIYQDAILDYVERLHQNGLYVILDLHWTAPGSNPAQAQQPMADKDHSPEFWSEVADAYKDDPMVVFDLFNEPFLGWQGTPLDAQHKPVNAGTWDPWNCWLHGCNMAQWVPNTGTPVYLTWQTAGMQSLVDVVRQAGATQPIMLGGLEWSNDMTQWLSHKPIDPLNALMVSFHLYNGNTCGKPDPNNTDPNALPPCWTSTVQDVAKHVPIVTGELGETDCTDQFIDQYMPWADSIGISYLAWTWNPWGTTTSCGAGPVLLADWQGTPTPFGVGYRDHLLELFP